MRLVIGLMSPLGIHSKSHEGWTTRGEVESDCSSIGVRNIHAGALLKMMHAGVLAPEAVAPYSEGF